METKINQRLVIAAFTTAVLLGGVLIKLHAQQRPPTEVAIGESDLGGVVTSPNGPEAGVWVIAETTDLPTKFAKMVVTDERGRYVIPDLPKATYSVWVRGYGLVDSPKVKARSWKASQPDRGAGANCGCGGGILSGRLLVFDAPDSGQERVSRHRPARQRHSGRDEDAALLDRHNQELVPILPCARLQGRPHDSEGMGTIRELDSSVDKAPPGRTSADLTWL